MFFSSALCSAESKYMVISEAMVGGAPTIASLMYGYPLKVENEIEPEIFDEECGIAALLIKNSGFYIGKSLALFALILFFLSISAVIRKKFVIFADIFKFSVYAGHMNERAKHHLLC